jgi:hypothetical protein
VMTNWKTMEPSRRGRYQPGELSEQVAAGTRGSLAVLHAAGVPLTAWTPRIFLSIRCAYGSAEKSATRTDDIAD